jgi:endonuclease YncB( thermonuclease family)
MHHKGYWSRLEMPTVIPFFQRKRSGVRLVTVLGACGVAMAFFLSPSHIMPTVTRLAPVYQSTAAQVTVIDGDTVRDLFTGRSVRLVGFNAPETTNPQCA